MFKVGILRIEDYHAAPPAAPAARLRFHLSRNRISYRLLGSLSSPPTPREIAAFDDIMSQMQLANGIWRTTFRARFAALNQEILRYLREYYRGPQPLVAHDWASSNGLTTTEWAQSLWTEFPQAQVVSSDLTMALVEASLPGGDTFIVDLSGKPIQYLTGEFAVRLTPPEPSFLPVNRWLAARGRAKFAQATGPEWRLPSAWLEGPDEHLAYGRLQLRKISLVHPETRELARRDSRFAVRRHSAFESLESPVGVIRSMNIFNLLYFPEKQLLEGARAVWQSLTPGGVWICGRTLAEQPPLHEVTFFLRTEAGFEKLGQLGERPSEIEDLVLSQFGTAVS